MSPASKSENSSISALVSGAQRLVASPRFGPLAGLACAEVSIWCATSAESVLSGPASGAALNASSACAGSASVDSSSGLSASDSSCCSSSSGLSAPASSPSAAAASASALAWRTLSCSFRTTSAMSRLTWADRRNSIRSVAQTGQGLSCLRARIERTPTAEPPPAISSATPANRSSRQDLQKLWPQGVDTGLTTVFLQMPQANSRRAFSCSLRRLRAVLGPEDSPAGRCWLSGGGLVQPHSWM